MVAELPVQRRLHGIDAFTRHLDDNVAGTVDHVGIIAATTDKAIFAGLAIQPVVALVADQRVVALVASPFIRTVQQLEPLDILAQHVAMTATADSVVAAAGQFDYLLARVAHHIDVVALAAIQAIIGTCTIQYIIARSAMQIVTELGAGKHIPAVGTPQHVAYIQRQPGRSALPPAVGGDDLQRKIRTAIGRRARQLAGERVDDQPGRRVRTQ